MKLTKRNEIILSLLIIVITLIVFIFSMIYFINHRKTPDIVCYFEEVDSNDIVSVFITTNSFLLPVLTSSSPPPEDIRISTRKLLPCTLIIKYESKIEDNSVIFSMEFDDFVIEKKELIPSSQINIPLE